MPTKLHFDKEHTLTVDDDVNAVQAAFLTAAPNPAPLAAFTKKDKKVFVNVALVRTFSETQKRSGRGLN